MNEQLRQLIEQRLSAAQNCPAKDDVIEEITSDLTERYNELVSQGVEPEEAMNQVQEGIGDLDEVAAYINEVSRRSEENQKTGNNNPFAGLDDLLRNVARDVTPSLEGLMSDLRSAAGHMASAARETYKDAREPIRGMASTVRDQVKNAVKSISITRSGSASRYDYTVPSEGLSGLDVHTAGGDVTFGISQDDNIYIVELASSQLTEDQMAEIQVVDGVLKIRQGRRSSAGSLLFSYGMLSSDFEIYLPVRPWNTLSVTTTSGDIRLEKGTEVASVTLQTTSGDIDVPEIQCGALAVGTVSGDVDATGHMESLRMGTVSGDMDLCGTCRDLTAKTTTGDMSLRLDNVPDNLELSAVSGDTKLWLPDNDGFALQYNRVSGDLRSDFDLKTSLNAKNGTAVYLEGGNRTYSMNSVSGDLRIYRR